MGAADVVPGVSGGTIAFITGIYEELIESIKSLNAEALRILFKEGIPAFWKHINGAFLLSLFGGIAVSVLTLSKVISYFLLNEPVLLWSFFFGLVLASIFLIAKEISEWKSRVILAIALGTIISFYITIATPTHSPEATPFLFLYGFLAIIAMILPGISGAFILLLLGAYSTVIQILNEFRQALSPFNIDAIGYYGLKILVFILGCLIGLMAFSRILSWMFKNYKNTTLALLTGFMIGSLNKIWPWKETLISRLAHEGKPNEAIVPFIQENVLPWNFEQLNDVEKMLSVVPVKDPQMLAAVMLMTAGVLVIIILNKYSPENV